MSKAPMAAMGADVSHASVCCSDKGMYCIDYCAAMRRVGEHRAGATSPHLVTGSGNPNSQSLQATLARRERSKPRTLDGEEFNDHTEEARCKPQGWGLGRLGKQRCQAGACVTSATYRCACSRTWAAAVRRPRVQAQPKRGREAGTLREPRPSVHRSAVSAAVSSCEHSRDCHYGRQARARCARDVASRCVRSDLRARRG